MKNLTNKLIVILLLTLFQLSNLRAQDAEVTKLAKQFCHSTNNFYYFKDDKKLSSKVTLPLSQIFDYQEATYFISGVRKTIMLIPNASIEKAVEKASKYFEQEKKYTFAVRGQSRTMFIDDKPVYRFYPYKNAIVFEIFEN